MRRSTKPYYVLFLLAAVLGVSVVAEAMPNPDEQSTPRRTALQSHVDFFDRDGDGIIHVSETAEGLRAIGLPGGRVGAWVTAHAIHAGLPKTHGGGNWWRRTSIDTAKIHLGVHGSDTGTYDAKGNYVHKKYLAIFKYDADKNGAIDTKELKAFHAGYKTESGSLASKAEFKVLMIVAGEKNAKTGLKELSRATLRSLYDGSLFYNLEKAQQAKKKAAKAARAKALKGIADRLRFGKKK